MACLISNIYNMVYTKSTLLFILLTVPCMVKGVQVAYLANKDKLVHWLQVMNVMASKIECWSGTYWTNRLDDNKYPTMMTDYE